jgi:hypothetical protein
LMPPMAFSPPAATQPSSSAGGGIEFQKGVLRRVVPQRIHEQPFKGADHCAAINR